ncbi:MAG: transglutaminase domain-containing protein [Planctomycetes bacterium]|nr:transglutaminase domain-containing protein [Planctomycetota bacterium]
MTKMRRLVTAGLVGAVSAVWSAGSAAGQEIVEQYHSKDWTLNVHVRVAAWQQRHIRPDQLPAHDVWSFDQTAVVFPVIQKSSTSELSDRGVKSVLTFDDRVIDDAFKGYLAGYHSGTRLGKWGIIKMTGRELELKIQLPVTCSRVRFNEEAAARAIWPNQWPPDAASSFEPQMFVDYASGSRPYDMKIIDRMVKDWTKGDVKKVHPVVAAKVLAREVVGHVQQIAGIGVGFNRLGELEGVALRGVPVIASTRRGNEFEMVCLLASVYRRAGIPARTVIGWDVNEDEDEFLKRGKKENKFRAWVEFALYDPKSDGVVWVPVDIVEMWNDRNRNPFRDDYWNRPLDHFGNIDDSDRVIPFAFQFHPPTTVRSYGSPGFWGWLMLPESPERAQQAISFHAVSTAQRAADQQNRSGYGGG